MAAAERWIGRSEVLALLGVKAQTLYAYVSRGRITARPHPDDPRRSLYDAEDVARLRSGEPPAAVRPAPPAQRGEADIHSALSTAEDGRLFYRGLDAVQLAQHASFEAVARRLWDARETNPFAGLKPRIDAIVGMTPHARLFAVLARRASEDPPARDRAPDALRAEAASVLNEAVDALAGPGPRLDFHQRLARGWKTSDRDAALIRRALALSADHGLDAAVLATRAASDGGASLAGAALAGAVTLTASGVGAEIRDALAYLLEARRDPEGVAAARAATRRAGFGFGSAEWPGGDPRAAALIEAMALSEPPAAPLAAAVRAGVAATGQAPNLALALALAERRLELPRDGAADLYRLGRLAGLLGHAMDQAAGGSPIRARLRYVGPEPGAH